MTTLDTTEQIEAYRLATLRTGLRMEIRGLRMSRGRTCYAQLKAMGYKGSREKVLEQVTADVETLKEALAP
tara:strand:+ start:1012 stop:1224 length:213 start_codon:yes stop_codon:yes gene_type:complete